MKNTVDFDEIVKACYQGPLEESPWHEFMQCLKKALSARYVTLLLRPPKVDDSGVVFNALMFSGDAYRDYNEHYYAQDPFVGLPLNQVFTVDEIVDIDQYRQSSYYKDYLQQVGVEYILGADLADENGYSTQLRVSRGGNASNFSQQDKALVESLLPHLHQAIELYNRIAHAEAKNLAYQQAFDNMAMGCIILDRKMQVLSLNKAADQLLQEKQGLALQNRFLIVGSRDENRQFRELIKTMLASGPQSSAANVAAFRIGLSQSVTGLGLLCRALPPAMTPDAGPSVAIFISDPEKPRLSKTDVLAQLFGLTKSEAGLALLLANGLTLDEAAGELGITRNTAKSHLSSAFSKTGVTRQPSLVQLILRSVATVG